MKFPSCIFGVCWTTVQSTKKFPLTCFFKCQYHTPFQISFCLCLVVLITYMLTPCITLTLSAIKNKSQNNKWKFKRYYYTSRPTKCAHIIYKSIYTIINKHIPRSNNNKSSNNSNAWSYIKSIRLLCHHFLFCRNYNLMLCQAVCVCVCVFCWLSH